MATQTVRTIYEAVVNGAQANLGRLARETDKAATSVDKLDQALDSAGKKDVTPKIDVDIAGAEAEVRKLTAELEKLEANPVDPVIRADVADSEAKIERLVAELEQLEKMDPSPQVTADTERAEAQLEGLMNRIESMNRLEASAEVNVSIDQARSDLDSAEAKLKALQGAKAEMIVTADAGAAEEVFEDVGDEGAAAGAEAGEAAGNAIIDGLNSTPILGAVSGILVGVGAYLGKQLMDDIQAAIATEDVFGAASGLDEATARKFGTAASLAYSNAWGESLEANMGVAQSALENALVLPDSTGREIQTVIEQLNAVADILDVDVTEAAEAAGNMIKNGLAADATEAFDIIIAGQQNGLNRSEDWLDTLREYSAMFESIGLSGAEAGGLIEQAMDAGARNSDVAADALKEFSIRAQDDSEATRQAFKDLGLDADEMGKAISEGGDTAKDGLDTVLDGLRSIEDPMARNAAGVALFGTMWEDMGNGAGVLAMDLDTLGGSWVNVGDTAADAMERMSSNAATAWESTKRTFETSIDTVLGGLSVAFSAPLEDLSGWMSTNTNTILGWLMDMGYGFFDLARAAIEFGASTIEVMGDVAGALDGIVDGIGVAVEAFGYLTGDQDMVDLGLSIQGAADDMETFSDNADGAAEMLRTEVGGALDEAERRFTDFTGPALLQTAINDAINAMIADTDRFVEHVGGADATIEINGETLLAEDALNSLIQEVSESNGTVDINGDTVLVEDALDHVMGLVDEGAEIVVTANTGPSEQQVDDLIARIQEAGEGGVAEIPIDADTAPAAESVDVFKGKTTETTATVGVSANIEPAQMDVVNLENTIAASGGTVTINGNSTPGDQVLDTLMAIINSSDGTVTIDGNEVPADQALSAAITAINNGRGTVTINGNASDAESKANHAARGRSSTIDVNANTYGANAAINAAARTRTAYVNVVATGAVSALRAGVRGIGNATGGVVGAGLAGGGTVGSGYGTVPAPAAPWGVDNVLWPTSIGLAGGGTLNQPLAGGEWVVNPISSKQHDATLRAINAGASRSELAASLGGGASGPSTLTLDGAALGALADAVRTGASQATIAMTDRVAASTYQRGASASRAMGAR
ncbi:phage tail tape measure protein [Brachybacterium sp.]|uniref:phage tail tape measure protein n=1 Tax=Brachybacterium sp. TaxID=1891286 RepID=UPI002ED254BA